MAQPNKFRRVGLQPQTAISLATPKQRSKPKRSLLIYVSVSLLAVVVLIGMLGPLISPYSFDEPTGVFNQAPNRDFWFGTDHLGRDLFVRVSRGTRFSLLISGTVTVIVSFIGVVWGSLSGFYGGAIDQLMMRILDVLSGIPYLLLVLLLLVVMESTVSSMIVALSLTGWIRMARIVRGEVLSQKSQEYVLAAANLGASNYRQLVWHIFPNIAGTILVTMALTLPQVIFTESFLNYLGLGMEPPEVSLGSLAAESAGAFLTAPWRLIYPSSMIAGMILSFNGLADGLQSYWLSKYQKIN